MGAAVVPIVGQIITSVVVGKVASTVASKLGLSDSAAGLVGLVAGGAAAAQIPGGIGTGAGSATTTAPRAGMDLSLGTQPLNLSMVGPSSTAPVAPSTGIDLSLTGGPAGNLSIAGSAPPVSQPGGMLSEGIVGGGGPNLSVGSAPKSVPIGTTGSTAGDIIRSEGGVVSPAGTGGTKTSWWDKLMSSEKTLDMIAGGFSGMNQSKMLQYQTEAPWKRQDEVGKEWDKAYPGTGSPPISFAR